MIVFLLSLIVASADPQIDAGKITRIDGPGREEAVSVRNSMGSMSSGQGDSIYVGDTLTTGPRQSVVLTLKDESELVIAPSSDFAVKEMPTRTSPSTRLQLLYGMVHALVKKRYSAERPFVIETPTAAMGVRGTEFVVEHDKNGGQSQVHTLDGTVAMAKSLTDLVQPGAVQLVGAGMMSKLIPGMNVAELPKMFDRGQFFQQLKGKSPRFLENLQNWQKLRIDAPKIDIPPKVNLPRIPKIERPTINAPNPLKGLFGN